MASPALQITLQRVVANSPPWLKFFEITPQENTKFPAQHELSQWPLNGCSQDINSLHQVGSEPGECFAR